MEALTNRLGTRFLVVTVVPNILLVAYVGFLIAAGAPAHSPSLGRAVTVLDGLTIRQIAAVLLGLLVISIATHPLQTPLIQILEGYWWGLPFGSTASNHFTERFRNELRWTRSELQRVQRTKKPWDWPTTQAAADAEQRQDWLPDDEQDLLPTALGNTLRTGEIRAGERYGLELQFAFPRISLLLSSPSLTELSDRRNQLDAAARSCIAAGLATAVSVALLLWHGPWLFLALVTYLLCWACYRAAVAAAREFCISLASAIDLHHLQLFDELQLKRPTNLAEELGRNRVLSKLFRGKELTEQEQASLCYLPSKTSDRESPQSSAELESAAPTADELGSGQ
jgi:hypothetical protein